MAALRRQTGAPPLHGGSGVPDSVMESPERLKTALTAHAREIGFDLFGVAPADRMGEDLHRLLEWLGKGFQAGMAYLARQPFRRADPQTFLPGARSLAVVAMATPPRPARPEGEGTIARYARMRDYHLVMGERIESLLEWLREQVDAEFEARSFVDAQPILERAVAVRAGLGFIGRNTCLIHPELGSRFVLGGFATSLALPPDAPMDPGAGCGECRRCLDACPTGALGSPHELDARRCLSYLTIEHRGDIPDEFADAAGERLFGCDACQDACPYNARETQGVAPPDPEVETFTLADALGVPSNREFQKRFGEVALSRCRRTGIVRNALIAASNLGRVDLADQIRPLASRSEHSDVIRQRAAKALEILTAKKP